jgi:epsin
MQYSDHEIRVREATGNEPWGASSKMMQEIADATNHYGGFNETMECILKR